MSHLLAVSCKGHLVFEGLGGARTSLVAYDLFRQVGSFPDSGDDVPSARVDFINTAPNMFCNTSLPKWGRRRRNDPRRCRPPCVCGVIGRPSAVVHRDMMRVAQVPRNSVLRSRLRRVAHTGTRLGLEGVAVVGLEICAGKLELVQFQSS